MALFVDLEDDDAEPPQQEGKAKWTDGAKATNNHGGVGGGGMAHPSARENPNRNFTTQALGCYP
jgi:hypothetical protein